MFHLIGYIVFGFIVGLVARLLTPGHRHMGLVVTSLLGIIGSVLAGWFGRLVGLYGPNDDAGFIMSTAGAVVLLFVYHQVAKRKALADSSKTDSSKNRDFPRKVA